MRGYTAQNPTSSKVETSMVKFGQIKYSEGYYPFLSLKKSVDRVVKNTKFYQKAC